MTNTTAPRTLRLATRGSQLALWQANHIAGLLRAADPALTVELVEISTTGDRVLSQPLRDMGGLGVFTREVQVAVLDGRADLAVHSLKDLPTESAPGLCLGGVPSREITADALVLPGSWAGPPTLDALPPGARIGTGSPRRQAQLLYARPDLSCQEIRGNVETRLRKLDDGEYDALVLASAGLIRLGLAARISARLSPPLMYPAVSQGAIGLECRADDAATQVALERISDRAAWSAALAERALLRALRAGCHAPVGAHVTTTGAELRLEGVVLDHAGRQRWMAAATGSVDHPEDLGQTVAKLLIEQGAARVLGL